MATPLNLTKIIISVNGEQNEYPVTTGKTANQVVGTQAVKDLFQIPNNVEVLVNGVAGQGDIRLGSGDILTFQTKAAAKAVK